MTENNKKFLVTKLTKETKDKIKMKSLRTGMTIDELVLNSINNYEPVEPCNSCGNNNVTKTNLEHSFFIGREEISVVVMDFPTVNCHTCNDEKQLNLELVSMVKKKVEDIVFDLYIKNKHDHFAFYYQYLETINMNKKNTITVQEEEAQ